MLDLRRGMLKAGGAGQEKSGLLDGEDAEAAKGNL